MPIDPILRRLFGALPARPATPADLDERRTMANSSMLVIHPGPQPGVAVEERTVPVEGGEITVRTFRPERLSTPMPTFVWFHGGGWFQGNLDTAEVECGPMASMVPAFVVSVDYRLAPEHKFPIPLEDCFAAYTWVIDNAAELGVDPSRVAVGGGSAGANLAAALCLLARDRGVQMPCLQLLDVPFLDLTMSAASMTECETGFGLQRADVEECVRFYLRTDEDRLDPHASPLLSPDLGGLPPAVVLAAEFDPVRDDGEAWVNRLGEAGVPGTALRVIGQIHGTWIIPVTPTSRLVTDVRASALRRAFDGTLIPSLPF